MRADRAARVRRGAAVLALLAAMPLGGSPGAGGSDCATSGQAEVALPVPAPGDTLRLPHRLIAPSSFVLCRGDSCFQPGRDYRLAATTGTLVWAGDPLPGTFPLIARYRYLPLPLAGVWSKHVPIVLADTLMIRPLLASPEPVLPPGARLEIGGSKTFAVEFGNRRDLGLQQSLDLTVQGQLAEDVSVRAALTDRRMPLQPEGTTAELSDLDQVLVELDAPWGGLRLGDIEVRQETQRFLSHTRRMEGLRAWGRTRSRRGAMAAVGRAVGEHRSLQRFGEEGNQGPYALLADTPGEAAIVVAGSERVWIDGSRMVRGEDGDYVIDYAAGKIRFTARRPIRGVTEMRIEYQVRQGAFERSYYAVGASSTDTTSGLACDWLRERDDPAHSPLLPLGDEERAALAAAGDSTTAALSGGVIAVGPGEGDYDIASIDSLAASVLVYVGEADPLDPGRPGGSYRVTFSDVGAGLGDYADSTDAEGETIYYFVGHKRGRFLPGRSLPLPASLDVLALRAGGETLAGLWLSAEGALSNHDRNVLSARDDDDNAGRAVHLGGRWQPGSLWGGRENLIIATVDWRDVDERFVSPEPLEAPFAYRRWNASSAGVLDGRDRRATLGLEFNPQAAWRVAGDWETLKARAAFRGERWHARVTRQGRISGAAELWRSDACEDGVPKRTRRSRCGLAWEGPLQLSGEYRSEGLFSGRGPARTGQGFHEALFRAGLPSIVRGLRALLDASVRWEREWRGEDEKPAGVRRLRQAEIDYSRAPLLGHLTLSRQSFASPGAAADRNVDLLDAVVSRQAPRSVLSGEWRARASTLQERERIGRLVAVEPGTGHYDSLGSYGMGGDYEFYFVRGDSSELRSDLSSALRMSLRPFAHAGGGRSRLSGLESAFFGSLEVVSPDPLGRLLGDGAQLLDGAQPSRSHRRVLRADLSWTGAAGQPAPRLSFEQSARHERAGSGPGRVQREARAEVEVRWALRRGMAARTLGGEQIEREGVSTDRVRESERRTRRGLVEMTWKVRDPLTLRSGFDERRERFGQSAGRRDVHKLLGGVVVEMPRGARVELRGEQTWTAGETGGGPFISERAGWNLTLGGSWRPSAGVSVGLRLRTEREGGGSAVTSGSMDVRAYF